MLCEVIAEPFVAPSVQGTETCVLLDLVGVPMVGVPGAAATKGITPAAVLPVLVPAEFVATIVKL